jgi:hypothetical protein
MGVHERVVCAVLGWAGLGWQNGSQSSSKVGRNWSSSASQPPYPRRAKGGMGETGRRHVCVYTLFPAVVV